MQRRSFWGITKLLAVLFIGTLLASCGGGGAGADPPPAPSPTPVAAPVITQHPASQTLPEGGAVAFSVSVQSATTVTYQWLLNGQEVGGNGSTRILPELTLAESGTRWSVRVTNAGGSVTSNEALLTVTPRQVVATPVGVTVFKAADASRPNEMPVGVDRVGQVVTASVDIAAPVLRKYGPDGQPRNFGDRTAITLAPPTGGLLEPMSYAMDRDGTVYVAYTRFERVSVGLATLDVPRNCEIYRITATGDTSLLLRSRDGDADFKAARALAVDEQGALYMTEWSRGAVFKRSADGGWVKVSADRSVEMSIFANTAPVRLAATASTGALFLADPVYRVLNRTGAGGGASLIAGGGRSRPEAIADGTGTDALFKELGAVVTDAAGNLYVTDWLTIRKITPAGVVTTAVGGTDDPFRVAFRALPGAAYGLAIDESGYLYFGTGGQIWKVRLQ